MVALVVLMGGLVVASGDLFARFMLVRSSRCSMVMTSVVMLKPCLEFYRRRRAKDHGYRRVSLKGYGQHHDPKQNCA